MFASASVATDRSTFHVRAARNDCEYEILCSDSNRNRQPIVRLRYEGAGEQKQFSMSRITNPAIKGIKKSKMAAFCKKLQEAREAGHEVDVTSMIQI